MLNFKITFLILTLGQRTKTNLQASAHCSKNMCFKYRLQWVEKSLSKEKREDIQMPSKSIQYWNKEAHRDVGEQSNLIFHKNVVTPLPWSIQACLGALQAQHCPLQEPPHPDSLQTSFLKSLFIQLSLPTFQPPPSLSPPPWVPLPLQLFPTATTPSFQLAELCHPSEQMLIKTVPQLHFLYLVPPLLLHISLWAARAAPSLLT